ncbi:unnamed protein product [Prunus brigantina]
MKDNKLVQRSYSDPHLTCIKYTQTLEVLCKIHDGKCGNHYVKICNRCQRCKLVPSLAVEVYHLQNSPWPLMQ